MYSLLLVDYNSAAATIEYIRRFLSVASMADVRHIVMVENGDSSTALTHLVQEYGAYKAISADGIGQPLYLFDHNGHQIVYCPSGSNLGYAKGNNLCAEIAQKLWSDPYYIISNNDIDFESSLNLEIAETLFAANPDIGALGPQVITPLGEQQSPHKWISAYRRLIVFIWLCALSNIISQDKYRKLRALHCEDICYDANTGPCGWISGCFFILQAKAFHEAGMFDPHTFLYAEEPILSRRLEAAGYSVWFCKEMKVIHRHAQTTKNSISRLKMFELDFDSIYYYYKTYTDTSKFILLLARLNFAMYKCAHKIWNTLKSFCSGVK